MNQDKAWESICRQIKKTDYLIIRILIAFAIISVGTSLLTVNSYVGVGIILTGVVFMSVNVRMAKYSVDTSPALYENYLVTEWLLEYFDEFEFDSESEFEMDELKEKYFPGDWEYLTCAHAFKGVYKGLHVRGAEVSAYSMDEGTGKKSKYIIDLEDPEYVFRGRIIEVEGHDTILDDLDHEDSGFEWWMQPPTKERLNKELLKEEVISSWKKYFEILDNIR